MMTFDDVYESLPASGWLTRDEALLLWRTGQQCRGTVLEVGCYQGRSTCLLAGLGWPVVCVDPMDGFDSEMTGDQIEGLWRENLAGRGITHVVLHRQRIEDWDPCPYAGGIGLAYLDGDHTAAGTVSQIRQALRCRPEAVAIHDVNDDGGGLAVKRAALAMLGPWLERVGRLAVWRMRGDD